MERNTDEVNDLLKNITSVYALLMQTVMPGERMNVGKVKCRDRNCGTRSRLPGKLACG